MNIVFLATFQSPDYYEFPGGDIIRAFYDGQSEDFDLSSLEIGDEFKDLIVDTLPLDSGQIIRNAVRAEDGILHLDLCQHVERGEGYTNSWIVSDPIDSDDYDQSTLYIKNIP